MIYYLQTLDNPVRILGGDTLKGKAIVQFLDTGDIESHNLKDLTATNGIHEIVRAIIKANILTGGK